MRKLRIAFRAGSGSKTLLLLAPSQLKHLMESEIVNFPAVSMFLEYGNFQVYTAAANQFPTILKEIGRLREASFRDAGARTGKAYDRYEFDTHYLYLFVWDAAHSKILGGLPEGPCG